MHGDRRTSGAAPGTLTFTLFVDTTRVFTGDTSGGGAAFDWNTRTVADGTHTPRPAAEGASGTSNTFVLAVDRTVVARQTTSGVHVTLAWSSLNFPNGAHTMTGTVTDAAGKTGSASRKVNVSN